MQRRVLPGFGPNLRFSGAYLGLIALLPLVGPEDASRARSSHAQLIAAAA